MEQVSSQVSEVEPRYWSGWKAVLVVDPLISPGLREAYAGTIEGFERHCRKKDAAATKEMARAYVDLQQLERSPGPAQLEEWKDALNWYFRARKEMKTPLEITGIPPLARADLGKTDWEKRLIQRLRELHFAWRTEETYRGWMWRFARFMKGKVETATAEDASRYLSELATREQRFLILGFK